MKFLACTIALCVSLFTSRAESQTFNTLLTFTGTGGAAIGAVPLGSLTLSGTTLYGMTNTGGTGGNGNIFSVGIDGTNYQDITSFTGTGGAAIGTNPQGNVTLSGSTLYGMTVGHPISLGPGIFGTIFSVGTDGSNFQNLVYFTGSGGTAAGANPFGSLTLSGTTFYGMTSETNGIGHGNIFSVGMDGSNYQNLFSFTGNNGFANGSGLDPHGSLTLSGTTLYGMSNGGGGGGALGFLFRIGMNGQNFQNFVTLTGSGGTAAGAQPNGSLTLAGTTLYGLASVGGANGFGTIFSAGSNGTNYKLLGTFRNTGGTPSGSFPNGSLTLSGTTLYGTTADGGAHEQGEIFSVGIDGSGYQDLYDFTDGADGSRPYGDLTLSGGTLFGMTSNGGSLNMNSFGNGTVFALTLPTPEPGTLALVGCGAAALVSYRWRRRRRKRW